MEAVRYHSRGDVDVLELTDVERPTPSPTEVLVDVNAASVNPVDAKRRQRGSGPLPKTTGSDFAGTVVEVGSEVDRFAEGDRVFGTGLHADRFQQGSFAEFVAVPLDVVAHLPDSVTFEAGAGLALAGVTAWRALVGHAGLEPGESCLVHGGSGGVGHLAVQLAARMGGTVVATAGRPAHRTAVERLGADAAFDYERADLRGAVEDATDGGPDVVLDHRIGEYLQFDVDVADFGGRIVVYGGGEGALPSPGTARGKNLTTYWMSMTNLADRVGSLPPLSPILAKLATLAARGDLTVTIDDRYTLSEAAEMHRDVLTEHFVGKLVLEV